MSDSDSQEENDNDSGQNMGEDQVSEGVDGFANVVAKILQQETKDEVQVLSKRKTGIMKKIEEEIEGKKISKKARVEKREEREKYLVIPDQSSADYERQLRKLATKGVVALFNAISKANQDNSLTSDKGKVRQGNDAVKPNVKSMIEKSLSVSS